MTVARIQSHQPMFNVSGLQAGSSYVLTVNSRNSKGNSQPITLYAFTVKEAEKHTAGSTRRTNERYTPNKMYNVIAAIQNTYVHSSGPENLKKSTPKNS